MIQTPSTSLYLWFKQTVVLLFKQISKKFHRLNFLRLKISKSILAQITRRHALRLSCFWWTFGGSCADNCDELFRIRCSVYLKLHRRGLGAMKSRRNLYRTVAIFILCSNLERNLTNRYFLLGHRPLKPCSVQPVCFFLEKTLYQVINSMQFSKKFALTHTYLLIGLSSLRDPLKYLL